MNIFHKITRKSLAKNRTRTVVTIIGIMLSMALFTAVIEGAYSGLQYLIRVEEEQVGIYHGFYCDVTEEQATELMQRDDIKEYASWQIVGISGEDAEHPNNKIVSVSDNFTDLVSTYFQEGRMPVDSTEIALPNDMIRWSNNLYSVGDSITLPADGGDRTYTIVGIYEAFDYSLNGTPTALLLTKGEATGPINIFFTLKNIRTFYKNFAKTQTLDVRYEPHYDLFLYHGLTKDDNLMALLYGFVAILVFLVSLGSISLIYNSFAISVSERTRQFGILKSIGATKKQIRQSVLYEALLLSGISILLGALVGCVGISVTLRCLKDDFIKLFNYSHSDVHIRLVLNPIALLAAALVCLITVLISAWIPAKRSARINAIEAVRQTNDIKINGSEVKTSRLTQKLFGFEGVMASKNFKRNRKRYRSTVISLFLSIVLFISATSFCSYLTKSVEGVGSFMEETDISYYVPKNDTATDRDELLTDLSAVSGVTDSLYMYPYETTYYVSEDFLDRSYLEIEGHDVQENGKKSFEGCVVFVNDAAFRKVCKDNRLNEDDYFDRTNPVGIMYNHGVEKTYRKDGSATWHEYTILKDSKYPCTLQSKRIREIDDYYVYTTVTNPGGIDIVTYIPNETEFIENEYGEYVPTDMQDAITVSLEEATVSNDFTVQTIIRETLFSLPSRLPAIIYPCSMMDYVITDDFKECMDLDTEYAFRSDDHTKTFDEMENFLKLRDMDFGRLLDERIDNEAERTIVTVVKVFSYGFIILISLIALANVFNTISTNIILRRREFAMLKSVGLGSRGFRKMMNYECIIYGLKGIIYGLPVAVLLTYGIYRVTEISYETSFYIPWASIVIAVGSVFLVVFATMLYATGKIRNDNPVETLKNENI